MQKLRSLVALSTLTLLVGGLATPAHAAVLIVTKTADTLDGACNADCSVREAITAANAATDLDTIVIPPGTYNITLDVAGVENVNVEGDLDVRYPTTIVGAGAGSTILKGSTGERVFHFLGYQVTLLDVTVTGGNQAANGGGAIYFDDPPGRDGASVVGRVALIGNAADFAGAVAVYSSAGVLIFDSLIANNVAVKDGGAMEVNGPISMANVTMSGNTAGQDGGAIYAIWNVNGTHLTITGNTANSDGVGGEDGGGISAMPPNVHIGNSIIAGNNVGAGGTGPDCSGTLDSMGNNLVQDATGCAGLLPSDAVGTSPLLGPLADNGGPTQTHALLAGSPAINTASDEGCTATDQRGVPRNGPCDKGAYERAFCAGVLVNRVGTDFDDVVKGTSGPDGFLGLDGNDRFFGLGGNDGACGGHGNDRLFGGGGRDKLLGQQDDDRLNGGKKKDRLVGGPGTDRCLGTADREVGCER